MTPRTSPNFVLTNIPRVNAYDKMRTNFTIGPINQKYMYLNIIESTSEVTESRGKVGPGTRNE